MQLEAGALVADRYRLEAKLGAGGMAVVWAATHVVTGKAVALKFLAREYTAHKEARARFLREARAASMVDHPHVVSIHDVVELPGGRLVMVMDLLVGESLRERLDRDRALSLTDTTRILLPVISAVGTAHNVGVVHRDLKPDNIFLTARPESVRVLDFGIAKLTKKAANPSDLTVTGSVLGTPHYMAPEQIFGERDVDARADVWAMGIILYECLTGGPPFDGENPGQILKAILRSKAPPLIEQMHVVPQALNDAVARMLNHERTDRPADLCEIFELLQKHGQAEARAFGPARAPITVFQSDGNASPNAFTDTAISGPGLDGPPTDSGLYDEVSGGDTALSSPGLAPPPALSHPERDERTGDTAVSTPGFAELSALPKPEAEARPEAEAGTQDTAVPFSTNPLRAPGRRSLPTKLAVGLALLATAVGTWALARSQNEGTGPAAKAQLTMRAELVAATVLGERPPTATSATGSAPASATATVDASAATSVASSAPVVATADKPPRVPPANPPPVKTAQPSKPGKLPAGVYGDVPF